MKRKWVFLQGLENAVSSPYAFRIFKVQDNKTCSCRPLMLTSDSSKPSQVPHLGYLELKYALQLSASIIIRQRMFCVFPLKSVCVGSLQSVHEPGAEVFVSGVLIQPWTDWLRSYHVPTETSRLPFASSPYFLKNDTHLFNAYRHHFPEIPEIHHIYHVPN